MSIITLVHKWQVDLVQLGILAFTGKTVQEETMQLYRLRVQGNFIGLEIAKLDIEMVCISFTNAHVKLKMGPLMSFFFFKLKLNDAQGRIGILVLWADRAGQRISLQGQGVSPRPGYQLQHKLTITSLHFALNYISHV